MDTPWWIADLAQTEIRQARQYGEPGSLQARFLWSLIVRTIDRELLAAWSNLR